MMYTLRCPVCTFDVTLSDDTVVCLHPRERHTFPIVRGVPILLNEQRSLFSIRDLTHESPESTEVTSGLTGVALRLLPTLGHNLRSRANYERFAQLLLARGDQPNVLVVGGGDLGEGMEEFAKWPCIELVGTDIYLGPRVDVVCDGHDLPFHDDSFDGVVIQAVLEHVVDPHRCVDEIHRVLRTGGLVYAETPFMQQVHLAQYDFTRFTHLGHRRLFRHFTEIDSGVACGPGMALAWSYEYFLLSFARALAIRKLIRGFARLTAFWLKYFDYLLIHRPGAFDGASGTYFMGEKSDSILPDKQLVELYRGAVFSSARKSGGRASIKDADEVVDAALLPT